MPLSLLQKITGLKKPAFNLLNQFKFSLGRSKSELLICRNWLQQKVMEIVKNMIGLLEEAIIWKGNQFFEMGSLQSCLHA